jgi:hypothetical protein
MIAGAAQPKESAHRGKSRRIAVCLGLLIFLTALPIRMSAQGNSHFPGLSHIERIAHNYCAEQLPKVAAAALTTPIVGGILSVLEDIQFSVVLVSVAPGKLLSDVHDSIRSLSGLLSLCAGLLVLGATVMGMITFICFKVLIPVGIIFRTLHECRPEAFAWAGNISRQLVLGAFLLWLYFPATALINKYVHAAYLDARIDAQMAMMETEKAELSATQQELLQAEASPAATTAEPVKAASEAGKEASRTDQSAHSAPPEKTITGFLAGRWDAISNLGSAAGAAFSDMGSKLNPSAHIEKMKTKIKSVGDRAGRFMERLMEVVMMFLLTTIVIPVGVLFVMIGIFRSLDAARGGQAHIPDP